MGEHSQLSVLLAGIDADLLKVARNAKRLSDEQREPKTPAEAAQLDYTRREMPEVVGRIRYGDPGQ